MNKECKQIKALWYAGKKAEANELTLRIIDELNEELENEQRRKKDR